MDKEIQEIFNNVLDFLEDLKKIPLFKHTTIYKQALEIQRIIKRRLKNEISQYKNKNTRRNF